MTYLYENYVLYAMNVLSVACMYDMRCEAEQLVMDKTTEND